MENQNPAKYSQLVRPQSPGSILEPRVSVLMPTFKQAHFIRRALDSLKAQVLSDWELLIIDDNSPDNTAEVISPYLSDKRLTYHKFSENRGLGAALNFGLSQARGSYISYLPSDDVIYSNHLKLLIESLEKDPSAILAFSGVRHHYNRYAPGQIPGYCLQLIQVAHRASPESWLERSEAVTDDLDWMFWRKLRAGGSFLNLETVTCEWVNHPHQRHKILQEPQGGINLYRRYYGVNNPLRYKTTVGNPIDEITHYKKFRDRPDTPPGPDSLKILLVGELAYNPERILALEERGHKLYGLWISEPYMYNTVGPLPFGHVEDLPASSYSAAIKSLKPDIIYALLNWQAVPLAYEVLQQDFGFPFIWHFKEGPFICLEKGTWDQLVGLHTGADGQIFSTPQMRDWLNTVIPDCATKDNSLILDGDLPKIDWFRSERSPLLSEQTGEIHTVVPGRPIGLHDYVVEELAREGIHLHFYGDYTQGLWKDWIDRTLKLAPHHLHLHPQVDQTDWVKEFSKYDAGWLHFFKSENKGDLRRATWDDLNYPARLATLAMAGLPLIQGDNSGSNVATQTLAKQLEIGLFFSNVNELGETLRNKEQMSKIRENVWRQRHYFSFDYHTDRLIEFFKKIQAGKNLKNKGARGEISR